jgi:hypothetical protein
MILPTASLHFDMSKFCLPDGDNYIPRMRKK